MIGTSKKLNKNALQILVYTYDSGAISGDEFLIGERPSVRLINMYCTYQCLTESQIRDLNNIEMLMSKNQNVFDNGLITKEEYLKNIRIIYFKFQEKAMSITEPKIRAVNKLDVHSLRASMQNIDNEN
ncbi:hypothetical protein SAMN05444360_102181 [Chryseobacterium carnipullorum]|uniref:hypothetical protein n=1 Tax=Chryseobacterium carnipullorum TaxID=1124835 RepID=UPI0009102969|nr:hypothetical protein [Chryseobacterium carnipullorum]SHL52376.1 hypothetical protein SAMN05444360_102181 [Chryseobacterium carnipullorum]